MLIRRIARPMLSAAFISRGVDALRSPKPAADAARPTLEGLSKLPDPVGTNVPSNAETVARVNAAVQIGGGLLLATGKLPRVASAALALTVVPGSLGGHRFWSESDPQRKADERRAFLTDVSLIGGLIIAAVDTEGKPSLGWRGRRAAHKVSEAVSAALPAGAATGGALADSALAEKVGHGLQVGAERGRELAHVARERGAELAEVALERGAEWAEVARERGAGAGRSRPRARRRNWPTSPANVPASSPTPPAPRPRSAAAAGADPLPELRCAPMTGCWDRRASNRPQLPCERYICRMTSGEFQPQPGPYGEPGGYPPPSGGQEPGGLGLRFAARLIDGIIVNVVAVRDRVRDRLAVQLLGDRPVLRPADVPLLPGVRDHPGVDARQEAAGPERARPRRGAEARRSAVGDPQLWTLLNIIPFIGGLLASSPSS